MSNPNTMRTDARSAVASPSMPSIDTVEHRREDATAAPAGGRLISYVLPVFNEAAGIRTFHERLTDAARTRPDLTFEFIYVNDGSRDDSLALLTELAAADPAVKVLDFSRNFGHQMAITAGLDHARGDAVIVMDTDLQDPPAVSLELVAAWEAGAEVVYAQRRTRRDTAFKRFTAHSYYRLLRRFADVDIPVDTGDFRLLDRKAADQLRSHRERNRFVRGLVAAMGFRQAAVPFDRDDRTTGATNYPLPKMLRLAADGVTSFSTVPLKMITRLGLVTVILALLGIVYALVLRIFLPEISVPGWTLLMIMVLFLGGVQILSLGVIGSYVGRIYTQVQQRPLYIVRDIVVRDGVERDPR